MADHPQLQGLMEEWDQSPAVREHMRTKGKLFAPQPDCDEVAVNVGCGEVNYEALAPLAKRLRLADGSVGQVRVPDVVREITKLFRKMHIQLPPSKEIKKMAKTAKAFMVLVKRKLGRDQTCRSKPFRSLMALVFDKDPAEVEEEDSQVPVENQVEDMECIDLEKDAEMAESEAPEEEEEAPQEEAPQEEAPQEEAPAHDVEVEEEEPLPTLVDMDVEDSQLLEPFFENPVQVASQHSPPKGIEPDMGSLNKVTIIEDSPPQSVPSHANRDAETRQQIKELTKKLADAKREQRARQAHRSLEECKPKKPIMVLESLPLGTDDVETLEMPASELNALAEAFHEKTPEAPSAPVVLRRFQFALKADLSEEPATKGRPKGEAKAKAKGKAKSRAKSAASKKGRKAAADAPEESAEAAAVDPKLKASGGESKADESMEVAEAEEEGLDAKPKRNCKKKQETAGSVSEKGSKRRRRAPNNASEQKGQKKEPDAPEEVVVEGGEKPEEEVGKKPANMSEPKGSEGKKRKGHASEVQERTFARRVRPKTSFPEAKWVALRDAFASHIKPKVSKPSTHEDPFWKFATQTAWANKEIDMSNVHTMASDAAEEYVNKHVQ
ncbi:unnamed protein product [Durusdinium trenchii]|uniref:Uncharacterized protein n=1 Tax=Durusdinium trenchii TaxID=1381693 RepID=A0ABP0PM09_9DINO